MIFIQIHAEIQVEIVKDIRSIKIYIVNKKNVGKECGTPQKTCIDKQSQADNKHLNEFISVTKNQGISIKSIL